MSKPVRLGPKHVDAEGLGREWAREDMAKHRISDIPHPQPTPAEINRDILDELSTLRQKVADMQTAKAFSVSIFDNIVDRLNGVERRMDRIDRALLTFIELRDMKGKA